MTDDPFRTGKHETDFKPEEGAEQQGASSWHRKRRHNTGMFKDESNKNEAHAVSRLSTVAGTMEFTDVEKERVRLLYDRIGPKKRQGYGLDAMVAAICIYVERENNPHVADELPPVSEVERNAITTSGAKQTRVEHAWGYICGKFGVP